MKTFLINIVMLAAAMAATAKAPKAERWPDGTVMDSWFSNRSKVDVGSLGRQYVITDYGVTTDSTRIQTARIQNVIDRCAEEGGGVVVVPEGTFYTGALFFKQGTHLHLTEGAKLKGSEYAIDFPIMTTRIEGETCKYFCALINADGVDGFTISVRNCMVNEANRVLWLKMRPDTPQHYEYVTVENIKGKCDMFLFIHPWTQFFKPEKRDDMPVSQCNDIFMRNINVVTPKMFDVVTSDKYRLLRFFFDSKALNF